MCSQMQDNICLKRFCQIQQVGISVILLKISKNVKTGISSMNWREKFMISTFRKENIYDVIKMV